MQIRVLVAEDNADLREIMACVLRASGHVVAEAADGVECIERALAFHPQVVVMDLQMPRMNGIDAILALRDCPETKDAAVIVVTGQAHLLEEAGAERLWDHVLAKPVTAVDIAEAIDRVIAARVAARPALPGRRPGAAIPPPPPSQRPRAIPPPPPRDARRPAGTPPPTSSDV